MKKISTKINFMFSEQEELEEFNMSLKPFVSKVHKKIKILDYKRKKKKIDASTANKLF